MKIAIVGAGIAGLSCAYQLERHGITPTIFEEKRRIGEDVDFNTSSMKLFDFGYEDPLIHVRNEYNLQLQPLNNLKQIIMHSPNNNILVEETNGYIFNRGESKHSLENQLASYVKTPIMFNTHIKIDDIRKDYDYVIDATGKFNYSKQRDIFTPRVNAFARIAVIKGSFQTNTIVMWLNTEYSKNCFCYLLANSPDKACLVLCLNDIHHQELDHYWETFITGEQIDNLIIKTNDSHHELGAISPHKIDNVYFVGKSGGFLDTILGFGMFMSIETGALAAKSIINNLDYEKLVEPFVQNLQKRFEYRKILYTCENKDYDRLVGVLGIPAIQQIIYNNPVAKITHGTVFAAGYNILHSNNNPHITESH